jgi:hypothetical protein
MGPGVLIPPAVFEILRATRPLDALLDTTWHGAVAWTFLYVWWKRIYERRWMEEVVMGRFPFSDTCETCGFVHRYGDAGSCSGELLC